MSFFNWVRNTASGLGQKINSGVQFLGQKAKDGAEYLGQKVLPAVESVAKFAKDVLVPIGTIAGDLGVPFAKTLTGYIDKGADWIQDRSQKGKNLLEKVKSVADLGKGFELNENGVDRFKQAQQMDKEVDESLPAKNLNQLYKIKQQLAHPALGTAPPEPAPTINKS